MFAVKADAEILDRLRAILEDEEEGSRIRLRLYTSGKGWNSRIVPGLGIDEADEEEDFTADIEGIPFVAEKSFIEKYGHHYELRRNEKRLVEVIMLDSDGPGGDTRC